MLASVAPARAQVRAVVTGTVRNSITGAAVANATVSASHARRSYVTGGDGTYRLVVDSSITDLHVSALGFAPASRTVSINLQGQTISDFVLAPSAVPLEQVVTIGTRVSDRTATQSAVPVDVISNEMLVNTGVVETWQQLQRLVPSVFGPHIPIGDNGMRPITLRGLAPHYVLVLVNGKRRHPAAGFLAGPSVPNTGFTDVNSIPASAIDHIEVLRDGASAQYGSDAIGGVVNLVLKSGERRDARTTFGQVFSSEGGRTFHDGRMFDADGTIGVMSQSGATVTLSAAFRDRNGTNRAYPDVRQQYFNGDLRNGDPPRISSYEGDGETTGWNLFASGSAPLGAAAEVYAFGGAANRDNISPDAIFRRPQDRNTVRAIFPNGFLPRTSSRIGDVSAVGGVRGVSLGWHWDVSSTWGGNRVEYHVDNTNNVSLGAQSPTSFYIGRIAAQQWTINADVSRDVHIRVVPASLAGGVEVRLEKFQIRAGDSDSWRDGGVRILDGQLAGQPASVGSQGMLGFRPIDEVSPHRSNTAAYVEAEARPVNRLLLQSALRTEHYSDFGSTSDGKFAGRLELLKWLAVRASVSSGFRAPSLTQEYFSTSRGVFQQVGGIGTFLTVRTFPVNSPEAKLMGATPLRPEKSVNQSAGLVINKRSLPLITADYYDVKIDDRIALSGSVTDPAIVKVFEANGLRGIGGGSYFTNRFDTRTRGVDVIASHSVLLAGAAALRILGGYNYNRTRVTRVAPLPPELETFSSALFTRMGRGVIEQGQPRRTVSLGFNYSSGPLGLNVHNQRSGPTAQLDQTKPEADQYVAPKWITDVRVSYQLRPRVQVALSGANVFDVYPSEWIDFKDGINATGFSTQGILRYPGALSPFGMNGRTVYFQLQYK
jgi:iron complex outermembrane receptor protein